MANSVRPGYMGLAEIDGTKIRCTSFSVNPNQDILFYNHVIGLRDTIPDDNATKKEIPQDSLDIKIQRKIWRPSPISISGGISFPATETSLSKIFSLARYANYFDIDFMYYCNRGIGGNNFRTFTNCRINGFDMTVTAGDIVNVSMDVVCKDVDETSGSLSYTTPQKLITWDQAHTTISGAPFTVDHLLINGFNFKINNNIQTIYTSGTLTTDESLLPYDLRVGMQEVTGNLSVYLDAGKEFIPIAVSSPAILTVVTPVLTLTMHVVFRSNQIEGLVGPVITQLPFVGVDYSFY